MSAPSPAVDGRIKWQQVLDRVMAELVNNQSGSNDRFYTIRGLADKYGISRITAQRVFRELIARRLIVTDGRRGSTIIKRPDATVAYICLPDACSADPIRLDTFRLLDDFLTGFRAGVDGTFASPKIVSLAFLETHLDDLKGQPILINGGAFLKRALAGNAIDADLAARLREALDPIVFFGFNGLDGLSQVNCDHYGGIRQAVDHLAAQGHVRLACLTGHPNSIWFRPRMQAFIDGLLDHGLPFSPERLKITDSNDSRNDFQALDELFALAEPPTAIVCANDRRALHVAEYCAQHGIRIPGQLAVTGFDNMPESSVCQPPLTTLDRQDSLAGRLAAELLWKRMHGARQNAEIVRVEPKLIIRESTLGAGEPATADRSDRGADRAESAAGSRLKSLLPLKKTKEQTT